MTLALSSYLTVAEADVYFASMLDVEAWEDAVEADQLKALTMATEVVDNLSYVDQPLTELHAFPRTGMSDVPANVLKAVCELALTILEGTDLDSLAEDQRVIAEGYDSVQAKYDKDFPNIHLLLGLTRKAYRYLLPWLDHGSTQINLTRVS